MPATLQDIGVVKQLAFAQQCHGKRVRFQAEVSTVNADGAGLWLTASNQNWHLTDSMNDGLLKETSAWQTVALVIQIPLDTTYLSYGLWMIGNGECRIRNPKFEVVGEEVPVTASNIWDRVSADRWAERFGSE